MITRPIRHIAALAACGLLVAGCDFFVSAEGHVERAEALVAKGEQRRALIELKNALQEDPKLLRGRLLLAEVALWLGDVRTAEHELVGIDASFEPARRADLAARLDLALGRLDALLARPDVKPLYRAQALQAKRQPAEAEKLFREVAAADPASIEAQVGIAQTLAEQGKGAEAREITKRLTEQHPDSALAALANGELLAYGNDLAGSRAELRRATKFAPRQLDVPRQVALLTTLIESSIAARDLEAAKADNAVLARLIPDSPLANLMKARVSMAENDYLAAATELRRIVGRAPDLLQAHLLLGMTLAAQGNLQQASLELGQVLDRAPGNIEARQLYAQVRMRLDDPDGALRALVPALEASDGNSYLTLLTDTARSQAGASGSVQLLEQALKRTPDNRSLQTQLASAYLQAGAPEKAMAILQKDSGSPDARRSALLLSAITAAEGQDSARRKVEKMLAENPGDAELPLLAAAFYVRAQDFTSARSTLEAAIARSKAPAPLLFTLAQVEWSAQRPEAARAVLERLVKLDPGHEAGTVALAQMDMARGENAVARARLEALRKRDPRTIEARLMLAQLALKADEVRLAAELVDEALAASPTPSRTRNAAGLMYLATARYDQAIQHFRAGTELEPTAPLLWLNLGRAQLAMGQNEVARTSLQRALTLQPGWLPAEGALVFLDVQQGNPGAARERIGTLKNDHPRDAGVLVLEGEFNLSMRQYAAAASAFATANSLQPNAEYVAREYEARRAGKLAEPYAPLAAWVAKHPEDYALRAMLATAYLRAGMPREAAHEYEAIIAAHPQHAVSLNNLAWLYYELKDPRALALAHRASALAPNSAAVGDTLGWILVESGKVSEGVEVLRTAVGQSDVTDDVRYHYAAGLARAGDQAAARAELTKLLAGRAEFASRGDAERLLAQLATSTNTGANANKGGT